MDHVLSPSVRLQKSFDILSLQAYDLCLVRFVLRITPGGLNATSAEFAYVGDPELIGQKCSKTTTTMWPIRGIPAEHFDQLMTAGASICDERYEMGIVFPIFYW